MRRLVTGTAIALAVALLLAIAAGPALADTLYLKNGKTYEGKLLSDSGGVVRFKTAFGTLEFPADQVERVEKGRTALDEFKDRLKATPTDDYESLLELARWCDERKLVGQRLQVLRQIVRDCPDHPGARREMGEIHRDGKWVKLDGEPPRQRVEPGKRVEVPGTRASLILPKDWQTDLAERKAVAKGPAPYAVPPVLAVTFGPPVAAKVAFPEDAGWAKPEKAEAGGLAGVRSRREHRVDGVARTEILALLGSGETGVTVRLGCLSLDGDAGAKAVDLVLGSLKFTAPPADYTNRKYGYSVNLPKGANWKSGEDEDGDLHVTQVTADAADYAYLLVLSGAPGDEANQVKQAYEGELRTMRSDGDVKSEGEYDLDGTKAKFADGTLLEDGYPLRRRLIYAERNGRAHLIVCSQHEFGQERSKDAWDVTVASFRFLD